jgi:hypothetical protein
MILDVNFNAIRVSAKASDIRPTHRRAIAAPCDAEGYATSDCQNHRQPLTPAAVSMTGWKGIAGWNGIAGPDRHHYQVRND